MADSRLDSLPPVGDRFRLGQKLSTSENGDWYEADDNKTGKKVGVRVVTINKERSREVIVENEVLQHLPSYSNIPAFTGVFKKQGRSDGQQVFVVSEFCDGGTVGQYVRGITNQNKRLPEDHIAFILRELVKAVVHCHENNVIHRNIKADNIFLTADGSVKLGNFGISSKVQGPESKLELCIGSPCWLAPEVATCEFKENEGYDVRADVWAIGIVGIELGDGKPSLQGIHPARVIFQVTRNPPPTLLRPSNWSQLLNDFIHECLEKSPENRPHSQELLEHPLFEGIEENSAKIQEEIALNIIDIRARGGDNKAQDDTFIRGKYWEQQQRAPKKMLQEDIAALEELTEELVDDEILERAQNGEYFTFVGDVLIALNPNELLDIYGPKVHEKYSCKARSDNAPHLYSVADKAYQDVLHNEEPQHILVSGETMSGKSTSIDHVVDHLLYLGKGNACVDDVQKAFGIIKALGNAETSQNVNSTRHVLQTQITFTSTGKVSGAIFWLYLLEKSRVTMPDGKHANFHIFYYFYDAAEANNTLPQWRLQGGRNYRFLRARATGTAAGKKSVRQNPSENVKTWKRIESNLIQLGIDGNNLRSFKNILAAILLLGEVDFDHDSDGNAKISNPKIVEDVAKLLNLDAKKFQWALLNYCVIEKGDAIRRHHKLNEAADARDVLVQGLYSRLVDWTICKINEKLSLCRAIFGDRRFVAVTDLFGFECYNKNSLQQLLVNCVNEQFQFYHNQRIFVWEAQDGEEEEIPVPNLTYYDNKATVDQLMAKPDGLMYVLDEASRSGGLSLLRERVRSINASRITATSGDFSVAHYTGRVNYDPSDFSEKNRDFLPPEMIETLRQSTDNTVQTLFSGLFSKSGNLTVPSDPELLKKTKGRWDAVLTAENEKLRARKYNTESRGQYSQTRQMRTSSASFRGTCLELLRSLAGSCGVHFIRCIRTSLTDQPRALQTDLIKQQIRALGILDTARGRRRGYSTRIPFQEFIRRYKFLAFDFDEPVEVTKENCRLLLIRLKMEGWVIGKTKVFLKYYNEEYLSRLYETQVRKIVKVQSMMRAFLAKRSIATRLENMRKSGDTSLDADLKGKKEKKELNQEEAAIIIQKQIRGAIVRKQYGPMVKTATGKLDEETIIFMRKWCKKWQVKSIFQVLLLYRATRHQDLIYFSQQSHLYNQNALSELQDLNTAISLEQVQDKVTCATFLPPRKPSVHKLPFRLSDMPYFDSTYLCDPARSLRYKKNRDNDETWDAPLQRNIGDKYKRIAGSNYCPDQVAQGKGTSSHLHDTPFVRENAKGVKLPVDIDDRRGGYRNKLPSELGKNQVYRGNKAAPRDLVKGSKAGERSYNPIREMEDKFRQNSLEGDEPPFNFQAMLRKTNTNRESLKRANDGFVSPTNNNREAYAPSDDKYISQRNNNIVFDSERKNDNELSVNNNNNERPESRSPSKRKAPLPPKTPENSTLELVPGLIVHGEVADL